MNICHSISALGNTNFYKTTKTIESFNKPIGNKAFSTNSLDRAATIKVRAKSMFKKKEKPQVIKFQGGIEEEENEEDES